MLYMIEASVAGEYAFITRKFGKLSEERAKAAVNLLNSKVNAMFGSTRFRMTPVLDI